MSSTTGGPSAPAPGSGLGARSANRRFAVPGLLFLPTGSAPRAAVLETCPPIGRFADLTPEGSIGRFADLAPETGGCLAIVELQGPVDVFGDQGVVAQRLTDVAQRRERLGVAGRAGADGNVAPQSSYARPRHRASLHRRAQVGIGRSPERRQRRAVERGPRQPRARRIVRLRRLRVPRTHFLADVAAVGVRAHGLTLIEGHPPLELDREIGETARRIQHVGIDERAGRAGIDTELAAAALLQRRRVGLERQAADDLRQEEPGPDFGIDHAGVLPDPAEPSVLRVDTLLYGSRVDVST